jgi:hypothetical protein
LLLNNSEDVRLSENKVSHECETPKGKVLAIKKKIESFGKKKKRKAKCGEKMSGKKKEMVRKKRVCRKSEETLVILHMLIFLICL